MICACLAVAGLIAAFLFNVEARKAGAELADAEAERERAELGRRALVAAVEQVDPTTIGVDAAAQDILPGSEVRTSHATSMMTFARLSRPPLTTVAAGSSS